MERPSVLLVAADEDRPRVQPLVDAITRRDATIVDDPHDAVAARTAVLIASPNAATSSDVDRLLAIWTNRHPASSVLIVLVKGTLDWNTVEDHFDPVATTALSARAQGLFATRPLWLDGRAGVGGPLATKVAAAVTPLPPPAPVPSPATSTMAAPTTTTITAAGGASATPDPGRTPAAGGPRRPAPVVIAVGLGLLGLAAAALVALVALEDPELDLNPVPDASSGWLLWLVLALGVAVGAGVVLLVSRLRRPHHPRTAPAPSAPMLVAPAPPRATVFISHDVDADHALAVRLADDLRSDVDVWMAPESIEPGEPWLTSVERGLGRCRIFLPLLSRASLASPWVVKEIQAAMELEVERRLRLVPVQVEACEVPILLRTYQLLRLASGYQQIVDQTRRLAVRPLPVPP